MMAEDLKLRQKATQELARLSGSELEALDSGKLDLLREISDEFEAQLDGQGVPLYAEEAFAVLTLIETLDAEAAESLEELQDALAAMRLAMIQKLLSAWKDRDKGFFVN
jgi:hypothetical protein